EVASAASKNRSKQHDKCFTSINELMVTEKQRSQPADEICGLSFHIPKGVVIGGTFKNAYRR
ncbi:hypothetical protein, partial [Castellaniella sp.]|uniref:hypothetical protein n=1 Tax=Castellaniella sp. TaxID=1955812 RepID=UPI00356843C8